MKNIFHWIVLINFLLTIELAFTQDIFQRRIGFLSGGLEKVLPAADGGFYFYGTRTFLGSGIYLLRTDSTGNTIWQRYYNDTNQSSLIYQFQFDDAGNIRLCGMSQASTNHPRKIIILTVDPNGNTVDCNYYLGNGESIPLSHQEYNDKFMITGYRQFRPDNHAMGLITLLNKDKTFRWAKSYSNIEHIVFSGSLCLKENFLIYGHIREPNLNMPDGLVVLTDSMGSVIWSYRYQATTGQTSGFTNLVIDVDSNFVLLGSLIDFNGNYRSFICKLDTSGNMIWNKVLDFGIWSPINAIHRTPTNGYVFAGSNLIAVELDSLWNVKYSKRANPGSFVNSLRDIIPVPGGGFVGCGTLDNVYDGLIVKTDSSLHFGCNSMDVTPVIYSLNINRIPVVLIDSIVQMTQDSSIQNQSVNLPNTIICQTSTSIAEEFESNEIRVFPNPFENEISITYSNLSKIEALVLMDMLGRQREIENMKKYDDHLMIPLHAIPSGFYLLQIRLKGGRNEVIKIFKK